MPLNVASTTTNTPVQPNPAHVQKVENYCTHIDYGIRLSGIRRIVTYVTGNTNHSPTPYVPLLEKLASPSTEQNPEVRKTAMQGIRSLILHDQMNNGNTIDPHRDFINVLNESLRTETDMDVMDGTLSAVNVTAASFNSLVPALYDMVQRQDVDRTRKNDARILLSFAQGLGILNGQPGASPTTAPVTPSAHLRNVIIAPDFSTAQTNANGLTKMFGRITYVPPENGADMVKAYDEKRVQVISPTPLSDIQLSPQCNKGLKFKDFTIGQQKSDPVKGTFFEADAPCAGRLDY